jgi:hypothetical protein
VLEELERRGVEVVVALEEAPARDGLRDASRGTS